MIITIDGPSASGKSSIARLLASKLGIVHLNSGLLFRAVAYILMRDLGYTKSNLMHAKKDDIERIFSHNFEYVSDNGKGEVIYNGKNLTAFLKTEEIDQGSSIVSTVAYVRDKLLNFQKEFAKQVDSIVIDGRDVGSVVFPDADFKIYLTASPETRVQRWRQDQFQKGFKYTEQEALQEINTRDHRDQNRAIAPLIIPKDAIVIDNSDLTLQETLDEILHKVCI